MCLGPLKNGLCGNRDEHEPHWFMMGLDVVWCHADQTRRIPYALERSRKR